MNSPAVLKRTVGRWQLFALGFGCIVGSGWVVVLGDWLAAAAPGGAVVGFVVGATVMLAVAGAYAELVARIPAAGGDFEFARMIFGEATGFVVGWFMTLSLLAVTAFEGIALSSILGTLVPWTQGSHLYSVLNADVNVGGLGVGVVGAVLLAVINYRGVAAAARLQVVITFSFLLLAIGVVLSALGSGSTTHLAPMFTPTKPQPWWVGSMWIVAITPFFLNGYQAVPQMIEERAAGISFRSVARVMYGAIAFATIFYGGVILAASMAVPWQSLPGKTMPASAAFESLWPNQLASRLILVAAALSVVKTWNGVSVWAARLILAQARAGFLPASAGRIHPVHGSPYVSITAIAILNIIGVFLGRGALIPLLNMASICVAFTLVLACAGALALRRRSGWERTPYVVPLGRAALLYGLVGCIAMAAFAVMGPLLEDRAGLPMEWVLIVIWAAAGAVMWYSLKAHRLSRSSPAQPD